MLLQHFRCRPALSLLLRRLGRPPPSTQSVLLPQCSTLHLPASEHLRPNSALSYAGVNSGGLDLPQIEIIVTQSRIWLQIPWAWLIYSNYVSVAESRIRPSATSLVFGVYCCATVCEMKNVETKYITCLDSAERFERKH